MGTHRLAVSAAARRARLAERHRLRLDRRTDDLTELTGDLLALHSTDPVTVYLSALARMADPTIAAVDAALYDRRTLLRHHAMRRTLWVADPITMSRMHATTTARYAPTEHRRVVSMLQANGIVDGERWLDEAKTEVLHLLREVGPMSARQLGQRIPALAHPLRMAIGKPYEGVQAAHSRVLLQLGFEAALVRTRPIGTWISGQYTWAAMDSWLPGGLLSADEEALDERASARDLARAWLAQFGPATTADLQWWMGWTLTMTRRALADAGAVEVDLIDPAGAAAADGSPGWLAPDDPLLDGSSSAADSSRRPGEPWVAVLPGLDPTVMGWKQRSWYLPAHASAAFDSNGNAGPTLWVDGQVVGGWAQSRDGELRVRWFNAVPPRRRAQLEERLAEVRSWIGPARFSVRFPAPHQKAMLT